jgi:predicted ester cyclase
VLMNMPGRPSPRLKKVFVVLNKDRARRGRDTITWLHELNGDPITGRERREYRKEIFDIQPEEDIKEYEQYVERKTEIDPPSHAMPLSYLPGLSDVHFNVTKQVTTDDLVATRWEVVGMHTAEMLGVAPTKREVTVTGMTIVRFQEPIENGELRILRATGEWTYWDLPHVLEQIGAAP